jgi:transposase
LRRAQAVREVVAGHHVNAVSITFHFTPSALRTWGQRFAREGPQGLRDRPQFGRLPKMTCDLERQLQRLVDQDPLQHGAHSSQWSCRALAIVLARETGVHLGRERVRGVLKKGSVPQLP